MTEINKKWQGADWIVRSNLQTIGSSLAGGAPRIPCALRAAIMDAVTPSKFTSFIQLLNESSAENALIPKSLCGRLGNVQRETSSTGRNKPKRNATGAMQVAAFSACLCPIHQ